MKPASQAPAGLAATRLDTASSTPLYRQIYEALRQDILTGELCRGQRLAATRAMAKELQVARNTVLEAIEQLIAEGYLTARVGAGTYVAEDLPEELLRVGERRRVADRQAGEVPPISSRGHRFRGWAAPAGADRSRPFQLGRPAVDAFPWKVWSRLLSRRARQLSREWLDYSDSAGYPPLRQALADYLRSSRGLSCTAEQILIVRGSQQGLDLAARVLLDPGDAVWMEDPGYPAARAAFAAAGAREIPVPLDQEGLQVDHGRAAGETARLAYVTPSHQYPLGVTLSLPRRLQLLQWARENKAWIIEDDYDSEYRFAGRPLTSLAGLDGGRHVIYLGTLSKVLFPALRLGYLVVPEEHVDAFAGARYTSDRHTGVLEQAVVTDFFDHGLFAQHVRRMRLLYAERQQALHAAAVEWVPEDLELQISETGLHCVGRLLRHHDDQAIAHRALEQGVRAAALSTYCRKHPQPPSLLFGYAGFPTDELIGAMRRMKEIFHDDQAASDKFLSIP